ncbi:MAG: HDIG domain-containing metalloprotein [Myxococcota bacterium]|nr:HDIG domain-containing metalloprotein [Myxococcota bacterium]
MPLDSLFLVYEKAGEADYIGEPVSQLEHMQQAAWLARQAGADEELILGAFFHDIGHLVAPAGAPQMEGLGVLNHEQLGAQRLRDCGFPDRVADLVGLHVQAKRYLCFSRPGYAEKLSDASRGTLAFQGGVMSAQEAKRFEQHPLFGDILRLRAWDEAAKVENGQGMDLGELRRMAEKCRRSGC